MFWLLLLSGGLLYVLSHFVVKAVYLSNRFYVLLAVTIVLFLLAYFIPEMETTARIAFVLLSVLFAADLFFLFAINRKPVVERIVPERLSNGDANHITITVQNRYPFKIHAVLIDELPEQFEERNFKRSLYLKPGETKEEHYSLRPLERGEYKFGAVQFFASSLLGLVERKFAGAQEQMVPVYPSFIRMRQYQLHAEAAQTKEAGNRRLRKIGHSMEFEQVKEYVQGDDVRNINWKATARKASLMVNSYTEEKSQQVYCIVDKGRLMKMPFQGLTLLDHAINASLVMCNVALNKQDRFGLMTFSNKAGSMLAADRKPVQLEKVLQLLYNQQTAFLESDFELLYTRIRASIKQRSLIILFTNFESLTGMQRQMQYLKRIAKYHLLLVVFFENTELKQVSQQEVKDLEDLYVKTIAGKYMHEKQLIVKELQNAGILSILSAPENVTVNTINKYIEIKTRQAI
ncbi:uncharacterized protein (DUF58 family) [Lacibacter cauensis]|uniref:Uncharacterized protein (DUF58 family) n=1 Tax=Lacibacter cauensis TaxID=510947 RepID=A0A562SVZ9_9BACT|nr:DUF58 domain-containing protein [Lacibacter cauensis]TWI85467.1 uncharacterized protein (DUF58 family) [Lacibacter cauensis]